MAARAATGDIIVHWDDDDMYASDRIEKQVAPIARGSPTSPPSAVVLALPAGVHEVEDGGTFMGSLAYRRSLVDEFEFADVSLGEDLHFADRATSACHTHQIVEGVASVYVRHTGTATAAVSCATRRARPPPPRPRPRPARHPLTPSPTLLPLQWRWDGRPARPSLSGSASARARRSSPGGAPSAPPGRARLRDARAARGIRGGGRGDGGVGGRCPIVANHRPEGMLEETHFPAMHPKCCRVPGDVRCSAHRRLGASGSGSGSGNGLSSPPAWSSEGDGCETGWLKDMWPQGVGTIVGRVCPENSFDPFPIKYDHWRPDENGIIQYSAAPTPEPHHTATCGRLRRR